MPTSPRGVIFSRRSTAPKMVANAGLRAQNSPAQQRAPAYGAPRDMTQSFPKQQRQQHKGQQESHRQQIEGRHRPQTQLVEHKGRAAGDDNAGQQQLGAFF